MNIEHILSGLYLKALKEGGTGISISLVKDNNIPLCVHQQELIKGMARIAAATYSKGRICYLHIDFPYRKGHICLMVQPIITFVHLMARMYIKHPVILITA